jgi:catechol 2,3-dioxygenase-like lactoylglutathione lyase family enzyme
MTPHPKRSPATAGVGMNRFPGGAVALRAPNGPGRIELTRYHTPASPGGDQPAPVNALGMHRIMFAVHDIEDVIDRLKPHGAELVGEVVQYEDSHRLAYLRGPAGIIVALAEQTK